MDKISKGGLERCFEGNGGNDTIDGGSDFDNAYSGNFSDYSFSIANKIVTVTIIDHQQMMA